MAPSLKRKPRNSLRFDLASASPRPVVAVVPIILGEMEATATGVTGRTLREERERGEKEGGREEKLPFHVITIGARARQPTDPRRRRRRRPPSDRRSVENHP